MLRTGFASMTSEQPSEILPGPSASLLRACQSATLALALFATALVAIGWANAPRAFAPQGLASLGYKAEPADLGTTAARRITGFEAYSPLPAVGVVVGDLILNPPRGALLAGETIEIRIARAGVVRTFAITGQRVDSLSMVAKNAFDYFPGTVLLVLGMIIALRKRRELAPLALACALLLGATALVPNFLPGGRVAAIVDTCRNANSPLAFVAVGYFLLAFDGSYQGGARFWILRGLLGAAAAWIAWCVAVLAPYVLGRVWIEVAGLLYPSQVLAYLAVLVLCGLALWDRWRNAGPASRQRLRWLFLSITAAMLGFMLPLVLILLETKTGYWTGSPPMAWAVAQDVLFSCVGVSLAYAILRYRVIDVGFVISRTFVFAVFTGLLLVGFGVAEWVLQQFVHFEGKESVLVDGAIAVGVFVAVHRARDWIEHAIERVFFRVAHDKEAALQHFLEVAPHFSEQDALSSALLAAIDAYSGSHGSGMYERDDSGNFALKRATLSELPREIGPNAEVVLELKTLHESHYFVRLTSGFGVLALPVIRQTELVGFVVVGEKVDRTLYRTDEIKTLSRAVREVGFDLYALRLEKVEERGRRLEQQNEALREGLRSVVLIARGVQTPSDPHRAP